ncbi:hypothetical protein ACJJTC_017438 [Scirpophaga incertulas]
MSDEQKKDICDKLQIIKDYLVKLSYARRTKNVLREKLSEAIQLRQHFDECMLIILEQIQTKQIDGKVLEDLQSFCDLIKQLYEQIKTFCSKNYTPECTNVNFPTMSVFDFKTAVALIPAMTGDENVTKNLIDSIELYSSTLNKEENYGRKVEELFVNLTISQADGNQDAYKILRPLNEKLAIKSFTNGLRNRQLSTILSARNYSSLKDTIRAAKDEEASYSRSNQEPTKYFGYRGRSNLSRYFRGSNRGNFLRRGGQPQMQFQHGNKHLNFSNNQSTRGRTSIQPRGGYNTRQIQNNRGGKYRSFNRGHNIHYMQSNRDLNNSKYLKIFDSNPENKSETTTVTIAAQWNCYSKILNTVF